MLELSTEVYCRLFYIYWSCVALALSSCLCLISGLFNTSVIQLNICTLCIISRMQSLRSCETFGKSLLPETSAHGMHGEPGVHLQEYSPSSSLASPVSVNSSYRSEYSTGLGSLGDQQCRSDAPVHYRQQNRDSVAHAHTIGLDADTGLTILLYIFLLHCWLSVITGRTTGRAECRYCIYQWSKVQKWVVRSAGTTRSIDKCESWHGGVDLCMAPGGKSTNRSRKSCEELRPHPSPWQVS